MSVASFKINGVSHSVSLSSLPADITLNTFIREHAQLTATKFMCLEGGCGACVVTVKGRHPATGKVRTWAANSCLTLLNTCSEWEITTCEGIGNKRSGYHPIQRRLAKMNGSQCGFCSPGFVMNMYALLESKNNQVSMEEVENAFGGNICRCTGYRPILDAMKSFASDSTLEVPADCGDIEEITRQACPRSGMPCQGACRSKGLRVLSYDDGSQWYWPKHVEEIFEVLAKISSGEEYMLVAGNTAHGVYRRPTDIKHFVDIGGIAELKELKVAQDKLTIGANVSLSEAMDFFATASKQPGFEYCQQLWHHFDLIANVPVRNMGTVAGNIAIKKLHPEFPSDVFITLQSLDAKVVVATEATKRDTLPLLEYVRSSSGRAVVVAFELPTYPAEKFLFGSYKIMPRAQNAHAYVNAAFLMEVDASSGTVSSARLCFGGITPEFVHATSVEELLRNKCFYAKEVVAQIFSELPKALQPNDTPPEPSPDYRRTLACGLLFKFLLQHAPADTVKPEQRSGGALLQRNLSSGVQSFQTQKQNYPISQPVQKVEALLQCSGEATYMNDTMTPSNTVHCAFVGATKVGAAIEQIDASEALGMPGVIAFYCAQDIPGTNSFVGTEFGYEVEEIFVGAAVRYYDQPLGMVVALSSDIANRAAAKVKVMYGKGSALVLPTLADVLAINCAERIHCVAPSVLKVVRLTGPAEITGKGIFDMGLQYHFSMEPQTCVAVPFEEGLQVWAATQWMDHTQSVIAKMLQIKAADVQLKVRRLGGGYGSKITRGNAVACGAALAAYKLGRPARFVQTIEAMMNCNGKRWGCRSDYEFHVRSNGKIVGLRNTFYEDGGCTLNENPVSEMSTRCAASCYAFTADNYKLEGNAVVTDAPSSTWCRAPGSVEGIAMIENILEHIAFEAKVDPADARIVNLQPGNKMGELLPPFLASREYKQRRQEIEEFNSKNRWMKKGIGLAIMEYPIHYFGQFPATVSIYHTDGSVVISHGGIEMGQGMNTKIVQVAAFVLGVPLDVVRVESSDTLNGANSMVTGGAVGSESLCFAVRKACNTLNDRLKPVRNSLKKEATWLDVVQTAWSKDINLVASDHYKAGDLQSYKVYGLALSEVEVDILTGNVQIRRVDILEDCGESLSPYVDIGQIEGAFVMCLGYWLSEKMDFDRQTGQLLSNRTWTYKPPGAKDIPVDFRIELLQGSANPAGFMRSKATGEPPCCLAISAVFAIRQAVHSARADAGLSREWQRLGAPTTPETIVQAAGTDATTFSLE